MRLPAIAALPLFVVSLAAQQPGQLTPAHKTAAPQTVPNAPRETPAAIDRYVLYDSTRNTIFLDHIRVIDGTGAAPIENATVVLLYGKVAAIVPPNGGWDCADCAPYLHLDMTGHTVFPGPVGMHDHIYYIARPDLDAQGHSGLSQDGNLELMRAGSDAAKQRAENFRNGMALEREFAAAGGLLLAGPDPTGDGGVLPGFGDQREVELLVDAGFTPVEALHVATMNGATYLGRAVSIGSVTAGKNADLVIVKGNPAEHIADIENAGVVFKDGIGYSSPKLLEATLGRYGQY